MPRRPSSACARHCPSSPPRPTRPARCSAAACSSPTRRISRSAPRRRSTRRSRNTSKCRASCRRIRRAGLGGFTTEIHINRGFWLVSWFKNEFAHRERALAAERGVSAESLFDGLIASVPPGSMGLVLQPYWSPGLRDPGPEAKGAIIGFGDVHTRAHLYRAMIEGLVYGLRAGRELIEARTK